MRERALADLETALALGPGRYYEGTAQMLQVIGLRQLGRHEAAYQLALRYRPSAQARYRHIDALFGEPGRNVIDWDLIEQHYLDVMRVVLFGAVVALFAPLVGARPSFAADELVWTAPRTVALLQAIRSAGDHGLDPDWYGVASLETRRVAGVRGRLAAASGGTADVIRAATDLLRLTRPAVVSREQRRVKTIWEAAADAGSFHAYTACSRAPRSRAAISLHTKHSRPAGL